MSIYFHKTLHQTSQGIEPDEKTFTELLASSETNFCSWIENLVIKTEAMNASLIVEAQQLGGELLNGYVCHPPQQDTTLHTSTGLASWPAAFSYPSNPPLQEWPNILSIMFDKLDILNKYRAPVSYFDKKLQSTYILCKIEPHVTMVIIYNKKKDNDSAIKEALHYVAHHLRLFKLVENLR